METVEFNALVGFGVLIASLFVALFFLKRKSQNDAKSKYGNDIEKGVLEQSMRQGDSDEGGNGGGDDDGGS